MKIPTRKKFGTNYKLKDERKARGLSRREYDAERAAVARKALK